MSVVEVWETSGLSEQHRPWVEEIIRDCTFPWQRLLPEIKRQRGTDNIPCYSLDLSRYRESGEHHVHDEQGNHGHIITVRNAALGVFWLDGRVGIEQSLTDKTLVQEVFLAEAAHSVDYFLPLSEEQKTQIAELYHPEGPDDHTWWETHDYGKEYWSLVGEAFMALFTHAYSDIDPWDSSFHHDSTEEMKHDLYRILGIWPEGEEPEPDPYPEPELAPEPERTVYKMKYGKKYHSENCWYVRVARKFDRLVVPMFESEAEYLDLEPHKCMTNV